MRNITVHNCLLKTVFFLLLYCRFVVSNLNLYLNQIEVRRLLGLSAELYYVRDGIVNEYALNFVVPVPAHISSLHFTWQSLVSPLPYSILTSISNSEALLTPKLNISSIGNIPTTVQTFSVDLPCTGIISAEVDVHLSINITLNRATHNVTRLNFKRRKICYKEVIQQKFEKEKEGDSVKQMVVSSTNSDSTPVLFIAVSCACAFVTLLAIASLACYFRNSKTRHHGDMLRESRNGSNCSAQGLAPVPIVSCTVGAVPATPRRPSYTRLDNCERDRSIDLNQDIAQFTIQRYRVRLRSEVLAGTFGRVYAGSYKDEDGGEEDVLVKTVTDHASSVQVSLLLQEGMAMYGLSHKNVLSVLGVSIEDHTAPFVIYPNQGFKNLKRFLQSCKHGEGITHSLTTQEVVDMALQMITGMQYLHKKRVLHKDLATRNCVVDDKLRIQISDNALARDLFPADYHCLGDNENRPIKWLSIESLTHKTFSPASDVWSFGVLLWELTTLAQQPYVEIDPFEMAAYLKDGYRLAQPVNCPDELFAVMAYCWAMSGDERPTFSQLLVCLQEFYSQLTKYV